MLIEEIRYVEKKELFLLEVANEEVFLTYEELEMYQLSAGDTLEILLLQELLQRSNLNYGKYIAKKYLSKRFVSSHKLNNYLKNKGIDNRDKIIKDMKNIGLIDDKKFIDYFIQDKINLTKMPKKMIGLNLKRIGFEKEEYEEILNSYTFENEYDLAYGLIKNKYNIDNGIDRKTRDKIYRFLSRKGFEYDTINKVMDEVSD